jgi:hypothetical protein
MEVFVQLLRFCSLLPAIVAASGALAADADNGKRLAETRCVTCHIVAPSERRVVTDAPPFEAIARKFASNPDTLAFSIIDPHPRMNVTLTRRRRRTSPPTSTRSQSSRRAIRPSERSISGQAKQRRPHVDLAAAKQGEFTGSASGSSAEERA